MLIVGIHYHVLDEERDPVIAQDPSDADRLTVIVDYNENSVFRRAMAASSGE